MTLRLWSKVGYFEVAEGGARGRGGPGGAARVLKNAEEDLCRKHVTIYGKEDLAFCRRQHWLHPPPPPPLANASTVAAHHPFVGGFSHGVAGRGVGGVRQKEGGRVAPISTKAKNCSFLLYSRSMNEVFSRNGNAVD